MLIQGFESSLLTLGNAQALLGVALA